MSEIKEQIITILIPILATGITGIFSWIGITLKNSWEKKINSETINSIASDTVRYVDQVYSDLQGPEKLTKAISTATEILNEKGIKVSSVELYTLIESSVNKLRK